MKFLSWNVNGLRAFYKKGAFERIFELDPDVFCLQETKAHPDQLPAEVKTPAGYLAYFDHSKLRQGYSGVAIFVKSEFKDQIVKVEDGLGRSELDQEGRFLALYLEDKTVVITCYFPNGGGGPDRLDYKLRFYDEFLKYVENLRAKKYRVIFCGDINTAHNEIDLSRPKENSDHTGFLRIERDWLDKVIALGWTDTFRHQHPTQIKYSWWDMKTFARDRNIGWRLDYFFISPDLLPRLKQAEILDNMLGSDHCPVLLELRDN